jgi:uncharacterized membrane protein
VLTQTGQYSATLNLNTADPQTPWSIPVIMNVILPSYAVSLHSDHQIMVDDRGVWVTHPVTVTNDGDDPYGDTFSFSYGGNGWITMVQPASAFLMPNESTVVDVSVFIPMSAMPGSMDYVMFTAESTSDAAAMAQMMMTTVARSFAPAITPPTDAKKGLPGAQVSYTLHLVNAGDYTDMYTLSISGNGWTTNLDTTIVELGAGESIDIVVTVTIPALTPDGEYDMVTILATSLMDPTKTAQATLTTTSAWFYLFAPIINN